MITIVDFDIGNLGSIRNMLKKIGVASVITSSPAEIEKAGKLILPGVGAFDAGMRNLHASGLVPLLNEKVLERRTPVLGICLGMQLMTRGSEEGSLPGLGWVRADTRRFTREQAPNLKIPHMGWNLVRPSKASPLVAETPPEPRFYFVHSYYVRCEERAESLLEASYGPHTFDAAFEAGHIRGVQFHPEKSHRFGMWMLKNFAERC
jgi:imidazole glycerol-phosphate synthase subunit HisH